MLSESELIEYLDLHAVSSTARDYIYKTRATPPSRLVGENSVGSMCAYLTSRKMGCSISCESHTAEYAYALEFEYSDDIFEFWNQPLQTYIRRAVKGQSARNEPYTPDFLVLSQAGPIIVEVKTGEEVDVLQAKYPTDWLSDDSGPHYLPAEEAFRAVGLKHVVLSTASLSPIRSPNLKLLCRTRDSSFEQTLLSDVEKAFGDAPFLTLKTLAERLQTVDRTPLLKLIDDGTLFALLSKDLLSRADTCWVALKPGLLSLIPEGNRLVVPSVDGVNVGSPSDKTMARYAHKKENLTARNARSARRWRSALKAGQSQGQCEYDALLPKFDRCGNRTIRLLPEQISFLSEFYKKEVASYKRPSSRQAFRLYVIAAETAHPSIPPVSYTTYRYRLSKEDPERIAFGRGGRRAANKAALPSDVEDRAIKATRAFEVGSMDHYRANIELVLGEHNGRTYTACPWITALVDLYDGSILAVWASVLDPSSKSCAMLFRRCIRMHSRLPEIIIVDRGSEFRSVFFMSTLSRKGVDIKQRPAGDPKYGSEVERLFGRFQERWLAFLAGNFANQYEARGVSGSHSPKATADLRLENFWTKLLDYEDFHNSNSMTLGQNPPIQLREKALAEYTCSGIRIDESPEFLVDTAIRLRDYALDDNGCIRTREQRFYTAYPLEMRSVRKKPPVHSDPENPHILYVKLNDRWIVARSSNAPLFESLDATSQYAQSIRIGECVNIQRAMREDTERAFIQKHIVTTSKAMPMVQVPMNLPLSVPSLPPPTNTYDTVRSKTIELLGDTPTEVMKYVMGKNSK